jgi:hypothetical protein
MTKDRARKHAARERAARTGERYVVAQRAIADPNPVPPTRGRLHELTHAMPGVPEHRDGGLQARARRARRTANPVASNRARNRRANAGERRVLVAWQNWIAKRLGAGGR